MDSDFFCSASVDIRSEQLFLSVLGEIASTHCSYSAFMVIALNSKVYHSNQLIMRIGCRVKIQRSGVDSHCW